MALTALGGAGSAPIEPIVETSLGRLRGRRGEGHYAFRGVRYAVAERFEPPHSPAPWGGIADALDYGAIAPQANPSPSGPPPVIVAHLPRPPGVSPPPPPVEDEDCLFLNVWTSSLDPGANKPVMVWLHGGFFYAGSGSSGDGSRLAARGDVVMVSLNHRLNAFGYTHLADIAGADFAHSGNLGMLDIVAALQWVKANIRAFGGDPDRVMLFGASGGGMKTAWLLASPAGANLFARAGVQSGPGLRMMERDRATRAAEMLLAELDLTAARADELRRLPMQRLLAAYHRVAASNRPRSYSDLAGFAPVIDPELLPQHPFDPAAPQQARDIPLLIGSNADEMSFFMGNDQQALDLDERGLAERAAALLGPKTDAVLAYYRNRYPQLSPARLFLRLFSDEQILIPTLTEADRKAAQRGAPVFAYHFDWESPALGGKLGSTHTIEQPFVFDQLGSPLVAGGSGLADLAARMSSAWVAFAATGDPSTPAMPWAPYGEERNMMRIGARWGIEQDPFAAEYDLLTA